MGRVEHVYFKVEGQWFTDFVRTRFWDENCGLDTAIKIIRESLSDSITEEMCIELLEGRKKFIGCNEFEFVDDNENIRSILQYTRKQERKVKINKIVNDIEAYPYNYIDSYACNTSRKGWFKPRQDLGLSISKWYEELVYDRGDYFDVLNNGCSWISNLEQTANVILNYSDKMRLDYIEFAEVIYRYYEDTINRLREEKIPFEKLSDYQQSIICRNENYASFNNIKNWNYLGQKGFTRLKYAENIRKNKEKEFNIEKTINNLDNYKSETKSILSDFEELLHSKDFDTSPIPKDKIFGGWDGFIDKQGNFYQTKPIGMAWYNGSANCHMEFAIQYLKEQNIDVDKDEKDYLINVLGWSDYSHFVLSSTRVNVNKPKKLTKAQEETLFKLFELNKDDMKYYYNEILGL